MKGGQISVNVVLVKCALCDSIHEIKGIYHLNADAEAEQKRLDNTVGKDYFVEIVDVKVQGLFYA